MGVGIVKYIESANRHHYLIVLLSLKRIHRYLEKSANEPFHPQDLLNFIITVAQGEATGEVKQPS